MAVVRRNIASASKKAARPEYAIEFNSLNGGLNLWGVDYRLDANQSPKMQNLFWQDGVLSARDGQSWVAGETTYDIYTEAQTGPVAAPTDVENPTVLRIGAVAVGTGHAAYQDLFYDHAFYHAGSKLYCMNIKDAQQTRAELFTGLPAIRGTFFRYQDKLYYKTKGYFVEISYDEDDGTFSASSLVGFVPVIQINTDAATGAGTLYQPENRISAWKKVWYNASPGVTKYYLPVTGASSARGYVDGEAATGVLGTDTGGQFFNFTTAPAATGTTVSVNNTVVVEYEKENTDAMNSVMDCRYAAVYGANTDLCIVLAGSTAQPNAYFWNRNDALAMNPSYFPVEYYNLAGDAADPLTGFGKQQDKLMAFSARSVGRVEQSTTTIDDTVYITMNYTAINSKIGCDLPWTIQLIENNLVFCNRESGVYMIMSTSAAYENNIQKLSQNVDGTPQRSGLLALVRRSDIGVDDVCSVDDGSRYWVAAGGEVYLWDYELSSYQNPSWFYFTGIRAKAFICTENTLWHMDGSGRLTKMVRNFCDYGEAIEKVYRFATQHFGNYDRLKDVLTILVTVRNDTDTDMSVKYLYDYGERYDATNLVSSGFHLIPRNLVRRNLAIQSFAAVFRRRPGLRHIRHFTMELRNNTAWQDMSIVSAQIFYRFQGRER